LLPTIRLINEQTVFNKYHGLLPHKDGPKDQPEFKGDQVEVDERYRGQGIGNEMVRQMLSHLNNLYMIDLCCDDSIVTYYESFGFTRANAMILRNYNRQSCT
jgi:predicted GNAT family N-acyltransferase